MNLDGGEVANTYNPETIEILLVDDREENLISLEAVLACPEYNLVKKTSGAEALRYLLTNTPAIILLDVQMPELNGFETASIIKSSERVREIPIIFITAINKDEEFVHKGYNHGAVAYIYKPYDAHILRAKVAVFADIRRQHKRISQLVTIQKAVTEALAEFSDMNEAAGKILDSICTTLGWNLGFIWLVDREVNALRCGKIWDNSTQNAPFGSHETSRLLLPPGSGLAGQAWKLQTPRWVSGLSKENIFPEKQKIIEGMQTGIAAPIVVQGETLGVLEFFSGNKIPEDHALLQIIVAIGSQIGQVLKRTMAFNLLSVSEKNFSFLVEASTALSSSLQYEETLASIAHLVVQSFADCCVIYVTEDSKSYHAVGAHVDPSKENLVKSLCESYQPDWNSGLGAARVAQTGKSEIYFEILEANLEKLARDKTHLEILRQVGTKTAIMVPLLARGSTLGVITFSSKAMNRHFTNEDLLVAEELGRRLGIAIDNARLLSQAQKAVRSRDHFFSIASHELKAPITALKLTLQLLQKGAKANEPQNAFVARSKKMLDNSTKQVERLTNLVDDLLDVVKIRAGKLSFQIEEFNLSNLVQEIADQYADALAAFKCKLELDLAPMVVGEWDQSRIEQVVVNLISNAIKYAPGSNIYIGLHTEGELAKLSIQDFGPGIDAALQTRIFDRFERSAESQNITGLGLGLFIAKQIVNAHQGVISLTSEVGKGSTFTIELPMHSQIGLRRMKEAGGSFETESKATKAV